ncbi:hypothetical protein M501DRAFT_996439 [Patellaria atrata CBS 101060]|uniref:Phospholipid/glycerol acyltransferase domain-containing protein n=1 Tax=Patellaria atrata CBS 101060 TaxID=1346257 RepID=A0A9P4S6F0_9PEZI|nr:hypothetical protein M501DRAFT_996439 [Patellaria atrata CBS 101060]
MEKYSQFRDRGSGIAPFFPVPTQSSGIYLPFHVFLFVVRVPLLISTLLFYSIVFSWLPLGMGAVGFLAKKAALWVILGISGVWWIDLQIDGVKRGSLAQHNAHRLPHPKTIIASSFTSPIDCLYLAAIFDPVFTVSFPDSRSVQRISLLQAIFRAFAAPQHKPPPSAYLTDLETLIKKNPDSCIVVFPECTTTNGRGILPFSPSILTAPPKTKIFPVNLRYTPADITTPVPNSYFTFLWNLCSKPTHCIRVRIAESVHNTSQSALRPEPPKAKNSYNTNFFDTLKLDPKTSELLDGSNDGEELNPEEMEVLDKIGEALARLGRVKRVGLSVKEKEEFVKVWTKKRS